MKLKLIKDIVLTNEQVERYTKELASDNWKTYYNKRNHFVGSLRPNW